MLTDNPGISLQADLPFSYVQGIWWWKAFQAFHREGRKGRPRRSRRKSYGRSFHVSL